MSPMVNVTRIGRTLVVFALLCLSQPILAAVVAGKVVFARGTPQAIDSNGTSRSLAKGSEVYAGDRLVTGSGRLQVSFVDGAFVSVQPDSEFKIDQYKYAGQQDGTESAVYDLIKGGVRAVTGLIGKKHPDSFKVHTAVATIGIRGTGFNTRLCEGDCQGKKDGLYHYTWEGTTYVFNNVQSRDVPTGSGVYVETINSPIEVLAQPPAVTAVDTGTKLRDRQRDSQDTNTVVASGDQRNPSGFQTDITGNIGGGGGGGIHVIGGLIAEHINVSDTGGFDANGLQNLSIFLDANGDPIGALFTEDHGCNPTCVSRRSFATTDLQSMLQGDDPLAVAEVQSLLAGGDQSVVAQGEANPAHIADFYTDGTVGWFRWTGGDVLVVQDDGQTNLNAQVGYQSIHIIFGPQLNLTTAPTGSATYTFEGGTQSTSLSGATIGQGVTSGTITISDFTLGEASLQMTVSHVNNYSVNGILNIGSNGGLTDRSVTASLLSPVAGSSCYPACPTYIDGGFAGTVSGGKPTFAGISYAIQETDPIIGVAGFKGP